MVASKKRAFGLSIDERDVRLIEVLADIAPQGRSAFFALLIEEGMTRRFGANWRAVAEVIADQRAASPELAEVAS